MPTPPKGYYGRTLGRPSAFAGASRPRSPSGLRSEGHAGGRRRSPQRGRRFRGCHCRAAARPGHLCSCYPGEHVGRTLQSGDRRTISGDRRDAPVPTGAKTVRTSRGFFKTFRPARGWPDIGWIMVAGRGALLTRSIVDITVGSPERLVFEGPPQVVAPLAQDEAKRAPIAHDGELVDTRSACPSLTEAERAFNSRS